MELVVGYMEDKKGNKIHIGDRVRVLWAHGNREYEGKVIKVENNIALLAAKDFFAYVHKPEQLVKIPFLSDDNIKEKK
jgi:hypothetical protein